MGKLPEGLAQFLDLRCQICASILSFSFMINAGDKPLPMRLSCLIPEGPVQFCTDEIDLLLKPANGFAAMPLALQRLC